MGPTEPTGSGKGREFQSSNLAPRPLAAVSGREGDALGIAFLRLETQNDREGLKSTPKPSLVLGVFADAQTFRPPYLNLPLFFSLVYLILC
jgi:hypothetical protein